MNEEIRELDDVNSEKVAGGASFTYGAARTVNLKQDEYDFLKDNGFISEDGKLKHADCNEAAKCLKDNGYTVDEKFLCFMYRDYKAPEYATVVIKDK